MRFSGIMQGLKGPMVILLEISFLQFFLLCQCIEEMPLGSIPYPLVTLAIVRSVFSTFLLIFAGIKLPGLSSKISELRQPLERIGIWRR